MRWLFPLVASFTLIVSPARGNDVMHWRDQARELRAGGQFAPAIELYERILTVAPDDGVIWEAYGLALLRHGTYSKAAEAFERSIESGHGERFGRYNIACAHALAGNADAAMAALRLAYSHGFSNAHLVRTDTDLASLHARPDFRELVGWESGEELDRTARWTADLEFLNRRLREVHVAPFRVLREVDFDRRYQNLIATIDQRTDAQIEWEIRTWLAAIGDGHTSIVPTAFMARHGQGGPDSASALEYFWFDDGVRVTAATEQFRDLVGSKLLAIGDLPIADFLSHLDAGVSRDNRHGARWMTMELLGEPSVIASLAPGDAALTLETLDGEVVRVAPPRDSALARRVRIPEALGLEPDVSLADPAETFFLREMTEERILYARFDAVTNLHHETLEQFADRVMRSFDASQSALVLDLRRNHGGEGRLLQPFLHHLIREPRFAEPGRLFVLVGRETFSAAMNFSTQIETHTAALFVGEPTGSAVNFVGESTLERLPYSGLWVSISDRYHQNGDPADRRQWIPPDLPAAPDFASLKAGRDPALDAVRRYLSARTADSTQE